MTTTAHEREMEPSREVGAAITVDDLSVSYRIRLDNSSFLADVKALFRPGQRTRLVPALRDVSFDVPTGSVTAVIGRNGAGKTTLLRTLSGVLAPEAGRVVVRGQMNLLAPGLGFNVSLSGRENIRLGGLACGMSPARLVDAAEEIADFAELGEYLDYPIKSYSSGMRARLAFAVAANLDPDILLIDEALSAGDAAFSAKVATKMAELCSDGRTIVLVTHNLRSIREMATDAIWLHQGRVVAGGDPEDVVARYMRYCRLERLDIGGDEA